MWTKMTRVSAALALIRLNRFLKSELIGAALQSFVKLYEFPRGIEPRRCRLGLPESHVESPIHVFDSAILFHDELSFCTHRLTTLAGSFGIIRRFSSAVTLWPTLRNCLLADQTRGFGSRLLYHFAPLLIHRQRNS